MKHGISPTTDRRLKRGRPTQFLHVSTDPTGETKGRSFKRGDLTVPQHRFKELMLRAELEAAERAALVDSLPATPAEPEQPAEAFDPEFVCVMPPPEEDDSTS
jgi:hypothetical protein